ncbi:streptophobe family protein [Streptomyces sp. NPDC058240]|uniref:streptophobe family protein n=1 Tax=Streptomyces sp. NPDC058240 TaxID=3346396 RepID=UPI0036E6CAA3
MNALKAPPPAKSAPSCGTWRNALEGCLSVVAAVAMTAATGCTALLALGAGEVAPLSQLVPTVVSVCFGSRITLASASAASPGESGGAADGLLGALGGLSLGIDGHASALPLMLTLLGTAVLAVGFFRPLRRRARPGPAQILARSFGALTAAVVLFPVLAVLARGTARLPEKLTGQLGGGGAGRGLGKLTGGGGLSSVTFTTDPVRTILFGCLWVVVVLGIGCVAARRTTLPLPIALSRIRLKWNPVASSLAGIFIVLCCLVLGAAALAGAAALTGRGQTEKVAGVLLLAGPNLLAVLLTSGLGSSWQAGLERQQGQGGGLMGALGGGGQAASPAADRSVALSDWPVAGAPVWLIGLLVLLFLLVLAGYLAAARTPARTAHQEADALLGRHLELGLRTGIAVALCAMLLALLSQASLQIGISVMGNEMGGMRAGLDGSVELSGLTGFVLAAGASYCGSRLHGMHTARRHSASRATRTRHPGARQVPSKSPSQDRVLS